MISKPLDVVIEEARLAVLRTYSRLPSRDVEGLSRLAHHTALSLGATHAAVSFVDDARIWFRGAFGFGHTETSREHSFCDAVVRTMSPLLVQDGRADPRFWQHVMVRGDPGLRCYAGVPLLDRGGYTLGTVAAYSTAPARFAPGILHDLAALAELLRDFLDEARLVPPSVRAGPFHDAAPMPRVQGWLGVKTLETREGQSGRVAGLTVLSVAKKSPALNAGLRPTDILQSIGGKELFVSSDVPAAMAGRVVGSLIQVNFRRAGQWHRCDIEVKSRRTMLSGR
ncbi:MAG: GAF domain-containing protein [Pseudomonadota bacterium]|nr:GAF domain-containing protein [Pseudomonadota bacterium]